MHRLLVIVVVTLATAATIVQSLCDCETWWSNEDGMSNWAPATLVSMTCESRGYTSSGIHNERCLDGGNPVCSTRTISNTIGAVQLLPLCPVECPWGLEALPVAGGRIKCCEPLSLCGIDEGRSCVLGKASGGYRSCGDNVLQPWLGGEDASVVGQALVPSHAQARYLCAHEPECHGYVAWLGGFYFYRRLAYFPDNTVDYQPYGPPEDERAIHGTAFVAQSGATVFPMERAYGYGAACPYVKLDWVFYRSTANAGRGAQSLLKPLFNHSSVIDTWLTTAVSHEIIQNFNRGDSIFNQPPGELTQYVDLLPIATRLPVYGASSTAPWSGAWRFCPFAAATPNDFPARLYIQQSQDATVLVGWLDVPAGTEVIRYVHALPTSCQHATQDKALIEDQINVDAWGLLGLVTGLHWASNRTYAQDIWFGINDELLDLGLASRYDSHSDCRLTTYRHYHSLQTEACGRVDTARCALPDDPTLPMNAFAPEADPSSLLKDGSVPCNGRGLCSQPSINEPAMCVCDEDWRVYGDLLTDTQRANLANNDMDPERIVQNDGCAFSADACRNTGIAGIFSVCYREFGQCVLNIDADATTATRDDVGCKCGAFPDDPDRGNLPCNFAPRSCETSPADLQWQSNAWAGTFCHVPDEDCRFDVPSGPSGFQRSNDPSLFDGHQHSYSCELNPMDLDSFESFGKCLVDDENPGDFACQECTPGHYGKYCEFVTLPSKCWSGSGASELCALIPNFWWNGREKYMPCANGCDFVMRTGKCYDGVSTLCPDGHGNTVSCTNPGILFACNETCSGQVCSGHGKCLAVGEDTAGGHVESNQVCECDAFWFGPTCGSTGCHPSCVHGTCVDPDAFDDLGHPDHNSLPNNIARCSCDKQSNPDCRCCACELTNDAFNTRAAWSGPTCAVPSFNALVGGQANVATTAQQPNGKWSATCVSGFETLLTSGQSEWCIHKKCFPAPTCGNPFPSGFVGGVECRYPLTRTAGIFVAACVCGDDPSGPTITQTTPFNNTCKDRCAFYMTPTRGRWTGSTCVCNSQVFATGADCRSTDCGSKGRSIQTGPNTFGCECHLDVHRDPATFCRKCYNDNTHGHYYLPDDNQAELCAPCDCHGRESTCSTPTAPAPGFCVCNAPWDNSDTYVALFPDEPGCDECQATSCANGGGSSSTGGGGSSTGGAGGASSSTGDSSSSSAIDSSSTAEPDSSTGTLPPPPPPPSSSSSSSSGLSDGAIAGIAIACIVFVAGIIVLILWLVKPSLFRKDYEQLPATTSTSSRVVEFANL